ncbi:hypothetical protein MANES_12G100500v8 [Manihot esculenta]|uniref:Uncharacterized protein n=1 Tax=Manihot esculenta TaxID=3983 RepID=A0ACB7GRP7_MANES|nr:hypothetical protein MANES_12G100500v8 [Manihot esculenta]
MEFDSLTITAPQKRQQQQQQQQQLSMCYLRGLFHQVKAFQFFLVLSCTIFCLATCGPCLMDGMQKSKKHDGCGAYGDDHDLGFQDIIVADASSGYDTGSPVTRMNIKNICTNSHSFCFPSTLHGLPSYEQEYKADALEFSRSHPDSLSSVGPTQDSKGASNRSWFSDSGMFELSNGQTVSCSLNSIEDINQLLCVQNSSANQNDFSSCGGPLIIKKSASLRLTSNSEVTKSSPLHVSSSPHVKISPPVLDWGRKHLHFPSVAFLTVANTCNNSLLYVYEPFSTNIQFYPCNHSKFFLGPGEVASVCFVFLPRWLGLSSAHLILQTSSGGFLVQVKGYALESPYKISPVIKVDAASSGRLIRNLSLFNPYNENLHVREISAWILVSQGNISHHTEAICSIGNYQDSDRLSLSVKDWLVVKSGQVDFPLMAMRPHEDWEIGPYGSGTVLEIDFSFESEAQFVGSFCMQLLRSSQDKPDTVLVPLEINVDGKVAYQDFASSVSVSLEALVSCDASNTFVAISLRNGAPDVLTFVKIREVAAENVFQFKYIQGLLLFPGTVTQVATITCTQLLVELHDSPTELSNIYKNCKLVVLTNDSSRPQIEIPCQNVIHICSRHQKDSSIGIGHQSEKADSGNKWSGSLDSSTKLPSKIMELENVEADEFVLENWKSQGITSSMSVLDDHEVLFPMVQVGTQHSKWITVKNPSELPVVMQLILNSGEIVDECKGTDGFIQSFSLSSLAHSEFKTTRYGFSMPEDAQTIAYVHPYGTASFGPIFFHPSSRCGWTSSALIRNNLSGVEWLSLRGVGASLSLVLLDGSEPIQSIEFNFNLSFPLNFSSPDLLFHMEETTYACSRPLSKELYAQNIGDLPFEVKRIEISGTVCGLDGFVVHNCNGFSLEPGESTKLLISYQSDFYAPILQRDLKLALASGIFVIPMRASLPVYMFNLCKKSVFWMRLKKFSAVVFLSTSLMFLICCCIFPQLMNFGSHDYWYKSDRSSHTTVRDPGKSARQDLNQKSRKLSMSPETDGLLSSVEGKTSKQASGYNYPDSQLRGPDHEITVENGIPTAENHKALPSLLSKSVVIGSPNAVEASQPCNLHVRTGKEKGRRRRKRKGVAAGLAGLFEVSSSQSGNSTPSSPLSPVTNVTPNRTLSPPPDMESIEARNPFSQVADQQCKKVQAAVSISKASVLEPKVSLNCCTSNRFSATTEQLSVPRKTTGKPVLLPSATFPSGSRTVPNLLYPSSPASKSAIAPHARAPGPKLYKQKEVEEKVPSCFTSQDKDVS